MSDADKIEKLKSLLHDLRALLADLQQWSTDANRIADMQKALDSIDSALEYK